MFIQTFGRKHNLEALRAADLAKSLAKAVGAQRVRLRISVSIYLLICGGKKTQGFGWSFDVQKFNRLKGCILFLGFSPHIPKMVLDLNQKSNWS